MSESDYGLSIEDLKNLLATRKHKGRIGSQYGGIDGLCAKLKTDPNNGIPNNDEELQRRRAAFGANEIPPNPPKGFLTLVWEALKVNALLYIWNYAYSAFLGCYSGDFITERFNIFGTFVLPPCE